MVILFFMWWGLLNDHKRFSSETEYKIITMDMQVLDFNMESITVHMVMQMEKATMLHCFVKAREQALFPHLGNDKPPHMFPISGWQ